VRPADFFRLVIETDELKIAQRLVLELSEHRFITREGLFELAGADETVAFGFLAR